MKKYFSPLSFLDPKRPFWVEKMVWLESYSLPNTVGRLSVLPTSDFPHANVGFSALRAKIRKNGLIFTQKSAIFGYNHSVFFSFPDQIFFFRLFVKRGGSFRREDRSMSDLRMAIKRFQNRFPYCICIVWDLY